MCFSWGKAIVFGIIEKEGNMNETIITPPPKIYKFSPKIKFLYRMKIINNNQI